MHTLKMKRGRRIMKNIARKYEEEMKIKSMK